MSDLIQLTCPTCGAGLAALPGMSTIKCSYCGNEFSVHQTAGEMVLEAFARCPICQRNDRVEKVSGIVARNTNPLSGGLSTTALAQALTPPSLEPSPPAPDSPTYKAAFRTYRRARGWGIGLLIFSLLFSCILFAVNPLAGFLIMMITGWISIFLIVWSARKTSKLKKGFDILWAKWRASEKAWRVAMNRWQKLYYCSRDDVVFIPGEGRAVPPNRMSELL